MRTRNTAVTQIKHGKQWPVIYVVRTHATLGPCGRIRHKNNFRLHHTSTRAIQFIHVACIISSCYHGRQYKPVYSSRHNFWQTPLISGLLGIILCILYCKNVQRCLWLMLFSLLFWKQHIFIFRLRRGSC
jgi:hypothetical protein